VCAIRIADEAADDNYSISEQGDSPSDSQQSASEQEEDEPSALTLLLSDLRSPAVPPAPSSVARTMSDFFGRKVDLCIKVRSPEPDEVPDKQPSDNEGPGSGSEAADGSGSDVAGGSGSHAACGSESDALQSPPSSKKRPHPSHGTKRSNRRTEKTFRGVTLSRDTITSSTGFRQVCEDFDWIDQSGAGNDRFQIGQVCCTFCPGRSFACSRTSVKKHATSGKHVKAVGGVRVNGSITAHFLAATPVTAVCPLSPEDPRFQVPRRSFRTAGSTDRYPADTGPHSLNPNLSTCYPT
jgi:hypothetical protein